MNAEDLIALNEEIAGMARAGLPLDQGLAALAHEMNRGRLRAVTEAIAADLRAGRTLPEALERQSGRVPPFYAGLVAAGIRTGRLHEVLATLTVYARAGADLRATLVNAAFYPAVVLTFAFGLFAFLFFFIFPQFDEIFRGFNMKLPILTELLLTLGRHPLQLFVLPFAIVVGGFLLVRMILGASAHGRQLWTRMLYAIPLVGTLLRSSRLAAFTQLLAILVEHGVPLPEALRLAGEASSDPLLAAAAQGLQTDLTEGMPLGEALRRHRAVPELVAWMTGLGEKRGALGQALHQVADVYRRQADLRAALLRSVLPPFLIISTSGVLVGAFVLSIMLPLIKLLEGLSK